MKKFFFGGLMVYLGQVVRGQVGVMYKLVVAEDVEDSLRLLGKLVEADKVIDAHNFNGEVVILTSFAAIEEAGRFLAEGARGDALQRVA